ncbi:hypothetical protein [Rubritalea tangerina]|uniref:hypothetical protein n=1 Tax=Rubritalea tangerina TaxID=430798 RepID=UPI00360F4584
MLALASVVVGQAYKVSESAFTWLQYQVEHTSLEESGKWVSEQFPMVADFLPEQEKLVEMFGQAASKVATVFMKSLTTMTTGRHPFFSIVL